MANGHETREQLEDDGRRQAYLAGVVSRSLRALAPLVGSGDSEGAHSEADTVLCEALIALGAHEIVDLWRQVPKWYA